LHVVSGDGAAARVATLDLGGDVLIWREALTDGPVRQSPAAGDHLETRASFLARGGGDVAAVRRDLAEQVDVLAAAIELGRPISLWFGRDLFCQVNLLALIAGLDLDAVGDGQLDLVLPASASCLAVDHSELAADFGRRRPLPRSTARSLAAAWQAFAAGTPEPLNQLAAQPALPDWARGAVELHRRRFPAVGSGLGADERAVLQSISDRPQRFSEIFRQFTSANRSLGYGDVQVSALIDRLAALPEPAVSKSADNFALTERGRAALGGRDLRGGGNDLRRNLGGVELGPDQPDWRWDPGAACVAVA
jgi:hypothetical protein